jgi:MFS family permease
MFRVLGVRDFRLVASGQLLSSLGDWLLLVAAPFFVLRMTGSTLATGLSVAAGTVPALALGPIAGVLADRWDRRRTMLAADLARAATVASMVLVRRPGEVWVVYAALVVEAGFGQFFSPAAQALLPELVGRGDALGAANSFNALINGTVRLAGGALGGVLYAAFGFHTVVEIDAASYVASAGLLAALRYRPDAASRTRVRLRFGAELRDGAAHVRTAPGMPALFGCAAVFFLGNAVLTALTVPYIGFELHAASGTLGLLYSALGVGFLVGAPVSRMVAARLSARAVAAGSLAMLSVVFAAAFNVRDTGWDVPLFALIGLPGVCFLVTASTFVARGTPDRLLGRVNSAYLMVQLGAALVGVVGGAALGQRIGVGVTADLGAALVAGSALLALALPRRPVAARSSASGEPPGVDAAPGEGGYAEPGDTVAAR